MRFRVHRLDVTASTNLDARRGAHGDVYVAREQTAGRGRLDHKWLSPPGVNLMMSAVLDVADMPPETVATFPLVAGLAVRNAAQRFAPRTPLTLKWPNDVLAGGRKLAGILCERNGDCVIAGIGVNVGQARFAPEIAARATSLALLRRADRAARTASAPYLADMPVDGVLNAVLEELSALYEMWRRDGFAAVHPQIAAVDFLKGKTVSVFQTDDDAQPLAGVCGGIAADGTLLVAGQSVYAGEAHVESAR